MSSVNRKPFLIDPPPPSPPFPALSNTTCRLGIQARSRIELISPSQAWRSTASSNHPSSALEQSDSAEAHGGLFMCKCATCFAHILATAPFQRSSPSRHAEGTSVRPSIYPSISLDGANRIKGTKDTDEANGGNTFGPLAGGGKTSQVTTMGDFCELSAALDICRNGGTKCGRHR